MYLKLDIKSFIRSLTIYRLDALHDVFTRYGLCTILKLVHRWHKLPSWLKLFEELLNEDSFLLIVFDSCRYDFFQFIYRKYLYGNLLAVKSLGPYTYSWIPKVFSKREFKDIKIFYAGSKIKTHDIRLEKFVPPNRNVDVVRVNPRAEMYIALPNEVNNEILRLGLAKRTIIWYMQPHYPWVKHMDLSLKLLKEVTWYEFTPEHLVEKGIRRKGISRHEIVKAYVDNLRIALKGASSLIREVRDRFSGRIVVTADHGEMLGEYGLYLHPHYELPQLYVVPWLEVEDVL